MPLKKGGTRGFSPNLSKTLELYYRIRQLKEDGYPSEQKFEELGLKEFV